MKICYLILAHNNFKHLDRLISAIDSDNALSFYIHIDKKVKNEYKSQNNKAVVIPERYDIRWGGYSMIEATISLLRFAEANCSEADYYILISGVDYPIRSEQYLQNLLSEKKEFIDIYRTDVDHKPRDRYEYYFFDYDRRNLKFYNPKFLLEVFLKKIGWKRKAPFKVYSGSQWFALTNACIKYILETIKSDRRYENFFRHTLVPDEAFIHTIIANSPFFENVVKSLVFADWSVPVPPAIIEKRHIDFLEKNDGFQTTSGYSRPYFARKFDDNSEHIIEEIESRLRK